MFYMKKNELKTICIGDLVIFKEYFVPYTVYTLLLMHRLCIYFLDIRSILNLLFIIIWMCNVQPVYVCAWCLFIFLFNFPFFFIISTGSFPLKWWWQIGCSLFTVYTIYECETVMRMVCGVMCASECLCNIWNSYATEYQWIMSDQKKPYACLCRCKTFP